MDGSQAPEHLILGCARRMTVDINSQVSVRWIGLELFRLNNIMNSMTALPMFTRRQDLNSYSELHRSGRPNHFFEGVNISLIEWNYDIPRSTLYQKYGLLQLLCYENITLHCTLPVQRLEIELPRFGYF